MNVLIFGGAGFIGSHFVEYLRREHPDCRILPMDVNTSEGAKYQDVRGFINIETLDVTPKDIIINLAAIHRTPGHPDYDYFETNIKGAENVCGFAERMGVKNIIFTSSIAPYGASEELKSEETLTTPNTPYGISKLTAELIHKEWVAKDSGRKLMILRPGVVFGKGENGNFTRLAQAIQKGFFFFPGRKDTIKACIYVKELVHQSWNLFDHQQERVVTYNFAYSPSYSIEQIASHISKVIHKPKPKLLVPSSFLLAIAWIFKLVGLGRLGIHPDRVKKLMTSTNIDGSKLKRAIGDYRFTLEDALMDWYEDCDRKGLY